MPSRIFRNLVIVYFFCGGLALVSQIPVGLEPILVYLQDKLTEKGLTLIIRPDKGERKAYPVYFMFQKPKSDHTRFELITATINGQNLLDIKTGGYRFLSIDGEYPHTLKVTVAIQKKGKKTKTQDYYGYITTVINNNVIKIKLVVPEGHQ